MRGRRPKPLERHASEGDPSKFGKGKLAARIKKKPETCKILPECPDHLSTIAKDAWEFWKEELQDMNLAARCDSRSLEMACVEFATYAKANDSVQELGEVIEETIFSRKGDPVGSRLKKNPWVDVRNRAFANVGKFTAEFGLSPVSRTRLTIDKGDSDEEDLMEILSRPRAQKGQAAIQ